MGKNQLFGRVFGGSPGSGSENGSLRTSAKFVSEYDPLEDGGSKSSNGNGAARLSHEDDDEQLLGAVNGGDELTEEEAAMQDLDFDTESELERKKRKKSLLVVNLVMFIQALQFSTFVSAIWPLLQEVGGHKAFLGFVVASYSLGQAIGSPIFGWWATRTANWIPFMFCSVPVILGNFLYSLTGILPEGHAAEGWMLMSRLITGIGGGIVAVSRSYTAGATPVKDKRAALTALAAFQALGFVVGPCFAAVFTVIGCGFKLSGNWRIDYTTLPAWMGLGLGALNTYIVHRYFKEAKQVRAARTLRLMKNRSKKSKLEVEMSSLSSDAEGSDSNGVSNEKAPAVDLSYDRIGVFVIILCSFFAFGVFSLFETIGPIIIQDEYGWSPKKSQRVFSMLLAMAATLGIPVFIVIKKVAAKIGNRQTLLVGLACLIISFFFMFPFGPDDRTGKLVDDQEESESKLCTDSASNAPPPPLSDDDEDAQEEYSCTEGWCDDTPGLPFGEFVAGAIFVAAGFAICNVMITITLSMMTGPGPQGIVMGYMTSANSFSRMAYPGLVTVVYTNLGPRALFGSTIAVLVVCVGLVLTNFSRLAPHKHFVESNESQAPQRTDERESRMVEMPDEEVLDLGDAEEPVTAEQV